MTILVKEPDSRADFSLDWQEILALGEHITGAEWAALPEEEGGLILGAPLGDDAVRGVHVAGGKPGHLYRLICKVTTDKGRILTRGLGLRVMER